MCSSFFFCVQTVDELLQFKVEEEDHVQQTASNNRDCQALSSKSANDGESRGMTFIPRCDPDWKNEIGGLVA